MGPTTAVQPAGPADHGEIPPGTEAPVAVTPAAAEPGSRQCGRCRLFFPTEPSALPQPKWWACPPCHHTLFGTD